MNAKPALIDWNSRAAFLWSKSQIGGEQLYGPPSDFQSLAIPGRSASLSNQRVNRVFES
jgi:hypothetical protein